MKIKEYMKKVLLFILTSLMHSVAFSQGSASQGIEMADALRASGKIYVVVFVLVVIVAGLFIYLITIDRKLNRFEKEFKRRSEQ